MGHGNNAWVLAIGIMFIIGVFSLVSRGKKKMQSNHLKEVQMHADSAAYWKNKYQECKDEKK